MRPKGRQLLGSPFDSTTFKWAIIVICSVIGVLLLACIVAAVWTQRKRRSSAAVEPGAKNGDVEQGAEGEAKAKGQSQPPQQPKHGGYVGNGGVARAATPPWMLDASRLPPGIVLSPTTPPSIQPLLSPPRAPPAPPYERLVLISSRVHGYERVAGAVLPGVAYVVYDWKNFTLQELLLHTKQVLSAQQVATVAVVAPGSKPGSVGLLEGGNTAPGKLAAKGELVQFWRALAGCCAAPAGAPAGVNGNGAPPAAQADGRRVDLLGCRVLEGGPDGAAALLKDLWERTGVPFAAADDARDGFLLSTFTEHPSTHQLGVTTANIPALDLYFNRAALLGTAAKRQAPGTLPPVAATAMAAAAAAPTVGPTVPPTPAPATAGPAPASAAIPAPKPALPPVPVPAPAPTKAGPAAVAEATSKAAPPAPGLAASAAAGPPPALPGADIFARLAHAIGAAGKTPAQAFSEADRDHSGQLSVDELTALMQQYVPGVSAMDVKHFMAMLDTEKEDGQLSRDEFAEGLPLYVRVHEDVRAGRDAEHVVARLLEYFSEGEEVLRDMYLEFDADRSGSLDHRELQQLVSSIPGFDRPDQKYAVAVLYQHDANKDCRLSFDELLAALKACRRPTSATPPAPPAVQVVAPVVGTGRALLAPADPLARRRNRLEPL